MSTKTILAWVHGEVKEIEVPEVEYIFEDPTLEDRIFALENAQSPKSIDNVTLYAANWVGEASPYSQVVEIIGVTPYTKIDLQPDTEQLTIFHEKDLAFVAENEDGVVTVFCVGQKPANDYTIQITKMEVAVNE